MSTIEIGDRVRSTGVFEPETLLKGTEGVVVGLNDLRYPFEIRWDNQDDIAPEMEYWLHTEAEFEKEEDDE